MAYTWPVMALSGVGMAVAVLGPAHKTAPNVPLIIVVGILWCWLWVRLMALRLHDVNRSAKWLLALWLLPAVVAATGGGQPMIRLTPDFFIGSWEGNRIAIGSVKPVVLNVTMPHVESNLEKMSLDGVELVKLH